MGRPAKKARLLDDSDSEDGGVSLTNGGGVSGLKVNEAYAKRFEHNKRREEKHRLEEKFGKQAKPGVNDEDDEEDDSSTSEEEDDEGELATEALDAEMFDVLNAIRSKDPRVYNKDAKFYKDTDGGEPPGSSAAKEQKPMNLRDYHRANLLAGPPQSDDEEEENGDLQANGASRTYAQQQQDLKDSIIKEMHAAVEDSSDGDNDNDAFLVTKSRPSQPKQRAELPSVKVAEKDPETFLSNFMASRAWVPTSKSVYAPLESDDDEEDARAEAFETAYNLRFEDPNEANKTLTGHARSVVDKYSVRREDLSGRQKAREREKAKKDEERAEREFEKARLRKLMVEEMQEKAERIRDAANLRGKDFKIEEWVDILNQDWEDGKWEEMLAQKFGDDYYADNDAEMDDNAEETNGQSKQRKPQWDDDIDIKDIVPDFQDEDDRGAFSLSEDDEPAATGNGDVEVDADSQAEALTSSRSSKKKTKDRKKEREAKQKAAKRDHRILDAAAQQLIDEEATLSMASSNKAKQAGPVFRYRATSPSAYGLTSLEILAAEDAQLNNWVGLKKLYPFREEEKKRKDKKRLSKKARLREWRKDTFGDGEGPKLPKEDGVSEGRVEKAKKKRKRKGKSQSMDQQASDEA